MKDSHAPGFSQRAWASSGIVGQVALLWTQLPKETNEIVRREAERRLEGVAERFPEELRGLAAISGARLATAAHSPILAALPGGSGPEDLAQGSELARRLAEENELSELVILDAAGLVRFGLSGCGASRAGGEGTFNPGPPKPG